MHDCLCMRTLVARTLLYNLLLQCNNKHCENIRVHQGLVEGTPELLPWRYFLMANCLCNMFLEGP